MNAAKFVLFILLLATVVVPADAANQPTEIVLVQPSQITAANARAWRTEGFQAVALLVESNVEPAVIKILQGARLDFHLWIEVARNPALADAHPRWMGSLGVHDDWLKRFPKATAPRQGEVAKAWPWVPIWYRDAYDAQLARVLALLERAPAGWSSVLLNDLQTAPGSCGCGNLQCRWATDYHVPATGERIKGDDVAARFLADVRARVPGKRVVPVWTTECEHEDLPANKRGGMPSTGLCGSVGCSVGACPKEFTKQFSPVMNANDGPIALLGLHGELDRDRKEHGFGAAWLTNAVGYLERVPPAHGGKSLPRERLWMVVQGYDTAHEKAARKLAADLGATVVIVARTKLDQTYEPRIITVK